MIDDRSNDFSFPVIKLKMIFNGTILFVMPYVLNDLKLELQRKALLFLFNNNYREAEICIEGYKLYIPFVLLSKHFRKFAFATGYCIQYSCTLKILKGKLL